MNNFDFLREVLNTNENFDKETINQYVNYLKNFIKKNSYLSDYYYNADIEIITEFKNILSNKKTSYELLKHYNKNYYLTQKYDKEFNALKSIVKNTENENIYFEVDNLSILSVEDDSRFLSGIVICKNNEGKKGLINAFGEFVTPPIFDDIEQYHFNHEYLIFEQKNKYGLINLQGKIEIEAHYDYIIGMEDKYMGTKKGQINGCVYSYRIVIKNNKYGIIDRKLNEIFECKYKNIIVYEDQYYMHTNIEYFIIQNFENKYSLYVPNKDIFNNFIWDEVYVENTYNFIVFKEGNKYGILYNLSETFYLDFPAVIDAVSLNIGRYYQIRNSKLGKFAIFDKKMNQLTGFYFDSEVYFSRNEVTVYMKGDSCDSVKFKKNDFFRKYKIRNK